MEKAALSLQNISIQFRPDGQQPFTAVDDVSFEIQPAEFVSLIGPSGCGKSTLLRAAAGLEIPASGQILVDGTMVDTPGADRGMVFQTYTLFPWLTVRENIAFPLSKSALDQAEKDARVQMYLQWIGLEGFETAFPNQLSGGMRQRVAIARALVYQPRIMLMDEPFGALDAQTRLLMQELLLNIWDKQRLSVLFVTHDVDEAILLSDRVLVMTARPGKIKADIPISLPRPRNVFELENSPDYQNYRQQLLMYVREEARKTFVLQEDLARI